MAQFQPIDYASIANIRDLEHLRLLAILHYVMAGISAFFGLFPIIYIAIGTLMVTGHIPMNGPNPPPPQFGYLFIVMGTVAILFCWSWAIMLFLSARFMTRHTHRTFSFVIAAISCVQVPLGTVLGIFTILVLSRPSVKAIYAELPPPGIPASMPAIPPQ